MNRGKSLRQQQQEWGLDLTGPEPVPMVQGETGDAAPPESISVPPYGQWGIDLTGAEPRPMAVEESQWGLDLTGDEPVPMMDYESPEAPPPGAAQPAPITASSRATRGSIIDQLAAPITQDERAVLEDPRASARAQAMRQMVGSISNRMAALAGLPMQPIGESPFVSERDKLRQFILQRGGVAERQAAGEEGRDIRREQLAAAETARLRSEKAAALARGDAMAAREADRKLRERGLELEAARGEREERRLKLSEKAAAAPKTPKAATGMEMDEEGNIVPKTVAERRQAMRESSMKPRPGWEPIDPSAPTFRSPKQAEEFDDLDASMGAIKNHVSHVLEGLEHIKKASFPSKEFDEAVGETNAQMEALAAKMRVVEGLNNTDAANHAIAAMLSFQGGSVMNVRNIANSGRLPAILEAAVASGEANLATRAEKLNLKRSTKGERKPSKSSAAPAAGPVKMKFPDGSVHDVSPEDMDEALERDAVPYG